MRAGGLWLHCFTDPCVHSGSVLMNPTHLDSEILRLILGGDYVDLVNGYLRIDSSYTVTPQQAERIKALLADDREAA